MIVIKPGENIFNKINHTNSTISPNFDFQPRNNRINNDQENNNVDDEAVPLKMYESDRVRTIPSEDGTARALSTEDAESLDFNKQQTIINSINNNNDN